MRPAEFKVINFFKDFLRTMVKNSQKGFSLLGVMIAMFITTLGLVGILAFSNAALNNISISKTKLIAAGLAQEGMEIVRNIRNSNSNWLDWYNSLSGTKEYYVEYTSPCLGCCPTQNEKNKLCPDPAGNGAPLKLDSSGYYQYQSGNDTIFYRKIIVTKVSDYEVKIVVEVKYSGQQLVIEDRLWNWK